MTNSRKKLLLLLLLVAGCALTSLARDYFAAGSEPQAWQAAAENIERHEPVKERAGEGVGPVTAAYGRQQAVYGKGAKKNSSQKQADAITVYVNGAVQFPGLYQLPAGARAGEAVAAAGGYTPEANADKVNIARRLRDGSQVFVPYKKRR